MYIFFVLKISLCENYNIEKNKVVLIEFIPILYVMCAAGFLV